MSATAAQVEAPPIDIRAAMADPQLFGNQFAGESWQSWRALLSGFYGLSLNDDELAIYRHLTGRQKAPQQAHDELWLAIGRRGGKSQCAALLAVYEGLFRDYAPKLAPGEVATVMCIAADKKQARAVFRYISGLLHSNPMLERMIAREDKEAIELTNRAVIETHTASFRAVRGYSVACVICDEIAFWRSDESANPDSEIIAALRPAMATLNGKLVALSSPYARRGELWRMYRKAYATDDPHVLVAKAPSRTMNPSLPQRVVDDAMDRDAEAAKAEYLAEFRRDIEGFVARETIEAAMRTTPPTLPYDRQHRYFCFVDAAGGGRDAYCMAIAHTEGALQDHVIIDRLEARHGTPAQITEEYAGIMRGYCIAEATGDKYGGSWVADEFAKHGIRLDTSAKPKSDLYVSALARLNSGQVELPPDDKMLNEFLGLERRTARSGRDSVDHGPGGHDDRANVASGAIAMMGDAAKARYTHHLMHGAL